MAWQYYTACDKQCGEPFLAFPSVLLTVADHYYQYCYYILYFDFKPLLLKAVLKLTVFNSTTYLSLLSVCL